MLNVRDRELISVLNSSYSFDSDLESDLNSIFPTNYYNPVYLEGVNINGEDFGTTLEIVEDSLPMHLERLVVPDLNSFSNSLNTDEVYGYYHTGSTIDSILIDEDIEDLYYIWLVSLVHESDTPSTTAYKNDVEGTQKQPSPCNGDGYCDPGAGEDNTCKDCFKDTVNFNYKVVITGYQMNTDEKPWLEKWLSGQYEFYADGAEIGPHGGGKGSIVCEWSTDRIFAYKKRKEICRKTKRGNLKGGHCPGQFWTLETPHMLDSLFNPYNEFAIVFCEDDPWAIEDIHYFGTFPYNCSIHKRSTQAAITAQTLDFMVGNGIKHVGNTEAYVQVELIPY